MRPEPALPDAGAPERVVHLCNTYRHLLLALAGAEGAASHTTVVYLQDDIPVPAEAQARLTGLCPQTRRLFLSDAALAARFANLPAWMPAILRRNLRLDRQSGLVRPAAWCPAELAGARFARGYIYHSGFFAAKVVAGLCDRVFLRESGMNNYVALPVPPFKALLRRVSALPPRTQIWGEEPWIDTIEVEYPDRLPGPVRAKARRYVQSEALRAAPPAHLRALVAALVPDLPVIAGEARAVLILTQPLDQIGLCSSADKLALYQHLAARLAAGGFAVFVKNHPREPDYSLHGTVALPRRLPIEAWEFTGNPPFALAVAIHSASLNPAETGFAKTSHQLFPSLALARHTLTELCAAIDARLALLGLVPLPVARSAP